MNIVWVRGTQKILTNRPHTDFVMSPIRGGGKSSFLEHRALTYLENGHTVFDIFGCFDSDTYTLSKEGWLLFKDVTKESLLATRDKEGYLEYQHPTAIQVYDYDGEMIQIGEGKTPYNLLITPDHRCFVEHYKKRTQKIMTAIKFPNLSEKYSSHHIPYRFIRETKWRGYFKNTPISVGIQHSSALKLENLVKIIGWYITRGFPHFVKPSTKRIEIVHFVEDDIKEILESCKVLGVDAYWSNDRVIINSPALYDYFYPLGKSSEKYIPQEVKDLPSKLLKILVETMIKGDGHRTQKNTYSTSSKKLADDFQEIAIKSGYGTSRYMRPSRNSVMKDGREVKGNHPEYIVILSRVAINPQIRRDKIKKTHYKGKIYDVTVPNGLILVMRKGKTCWSGNSRDGEGLAWCRCPEVDGVGRANGDKKLALVHSPNVTLDSCFDEIPINRLNHTHLRKYDVLVTASPLHKDLNDEYGNVNIVTDLLYERGVKGWKKLVVGIVREASNLYYSRLRVSNNQTQAKAYMIYLIREARHMGLALELDTLKYTSIDIDIRVLVDNTIFKGQGYLGLPDDLKFIYRYFNPDWIRNMSPSDFVILTKEGNLGVGWFPEVEWHKQEKENILHETGIKVIEHEGMVESQPQGAGDSVSDQEHVAIIEATAPAKIRNKRGVSIDKASMREMARKTGRAFQTISDHQLYHDTDVAKFGYCPRCRRAGGLLYKDIIKKTGWIPLAEEAQAKSHLPL